MSILISLIALVASAFASVQVQNAIEKADTALSNTVQEITISDEKLSELVEQNMEKKLGGQFAVGGETYYLSGSGISATQTTVGLTKFGYIRPDGSYIKFSSSNFANEFGDKGCGTIRPGNNSGKQEFVSFAGITQNSDGSATLTGVIRGLERVSPYTASTTLQTSHSGGATFVLSNSPPCFYQGYTNRNNAETIYKGWIFASSSGNLPGYDSNPSGLTGSSTAFASVAFVQAQANQGAATSTETNGGIVELATVQDQSGGFNGGADKPTVLQSKNASSSPVLNTAIVVVASSTLGGRISPDFIATTTPSGNSEPVEYTWAVQHTFIGTTTPNTATTTFNTPVKIFADSNDPLSLNGVRYAFPTSTIAGSFASSSVLMSNGSGGVLSWYPLRKTAGYAVRVQNSTGTQVVTHGLGVTPQLITLDALSYTSGVGSSLAYSHGFITTATSTPGFSPTVQGSIYGCSNISGTTDCTAEATFSGANAIQLMGDDGVDAAATITLVNETTFTISWGTNTNDGGSRLVRWTAE